jgi:hypothetical protein
MLCKIWGVERKRSVSGEEAEHKAKASYAGMSSFTFPIYIYIFPPLYIFFSIIN